MEQIRFSRQNSQLCHFCQAPILPAEEEVMLQSTECFHNVHLACFKAKSVEALSSNVPLHCPQCQIMVQQIEMHEYLSPQEKKAIEDAQMQQYMADNNSLATCPCGNLMEVAPGNVDFNAKDDKGNVMSPGACVHLAECRVRCSACE
jgi:hypothetical protein